MLEQEDSDDDNSDEDMGQHGEADMGQHGEGGRAAELQDLERDVALLHAKATTLACRARASRCCCRSCLTEDKSAG